MSTFVAKPQEVDRKWYVVDAEGQTLGRLSSEVAKVLTGKNKPEYTPFVDTGDFVIIINAEKIKLTGHKMEQKVYRHHTGYPGGLREVSIENMLDKHPERVLEKAIKGMLPKSKLGRAMYRKLKVYAGPDHNHSAQQPEVLEFGQK